MGKLYRAFCDLQPETDDAGAQKVAGNHYVLEADAQKGSGVTYKDLALPR